MKKLIMVVFALTLISSMAFAGEETKVDHYEGKKFKTSEEAMDALIETSEKMAEFAAAEELDVTKMEAIHETSYTTEDAVAVLGEDKKNDVKELAEKLEEVHLASEEHDADDVRRNFIAYQAELNEFVLSQK